MSMHTVEFLVVVESDSQDKIAIYKEAIEQLKKQLNLEVNPQAKILINGVGPDEYVCGGLI